MGFMYQCYSWSTGSRSNHVNIVVKWLTLKYVYVLLTSIREYTTKYTRKRKKLKVTIFFRLVREVLSDANMRTTIGHTLVYTYMSCLKRYAHLNAKLIINRDLEIQWPYMCTFKPGILELLFKCLRYMKNLIFFFYK